MKIRLFFFLLLALPLKLAHAATYYVDASHGNDQWSGSKPSRIGWPVTDGPWQSLAKVSAQLLMPGDSVLLKCGGTWHETLTLQSSGTAASPIIIGAYPNACANKPIISGATSIPAHNWIRDTGNIYKVSTTIDLITFGTFENGLGNWRKWSAQNSATMRLTNNCAQTNTTCMSFSTGSEYGIATSNYFTIQGKRSYTASFTIKAPLGARVQAIVRRGAPPWDPIGLATSITGTGTWQNFVLPFVATASLSNNARLDFAVPAGSSIGLDNVKLTTALTDVSGVFDSGKAINVAHHPNRGHDPRKPQSLFYTIAENADEVSVSFGSGSSYLTTGADLSTLAHPAITPGTGIRIRPNAWTINDRKISSISGSRFYFDSPTTHVIVKDWGYFLYGQRWMLDSPGEWQYNSATKTVSVWMADNATPGNRVSFGQRAAGIEASNLSHIRIDGLAIQNVGAGVRLQSATNIVLRNLAISDTLDVGVDAQLSIDSGIENSQLIRTIGDAISAAPWGRDSLRFHAYDNLIIESGVQFSNGTVTSLPNHSAAAILAGKSSTIRGNRIYGTSYIGIRLRNDSLISGNHIENTCLVLDDCGAIYTYQNDNSIIENNTIHHVVGGLSGKPSTLATQAQGIYLDELSSGITIRGNTVVDADNGIQLHNAPKNRIENNTLYGNRRHHLWLQEGSNRLSPDGDIHGNLVIGNRFFSTSTAPAIRQETYLPKTNTDRFASYDRNLYFTFLWPNISSESWPGGRDVVYTLPDWKAAVSSTNLPRNLDPTSREVNDSNFNYTFRTVAGNIVPNGNLSSGMGGWSNWNQTNPRGQMVLEPCPPASQCLRFTAGASESLLSSPNFSVKQGYWYKITFDLKADTIGQLITVVARRGGGGSNGFEPVTGSAYAFKVKTTNLQRYSAIFRAINTVNASDPVTLDNGARVDFQGIFPGQGITIANLEVVPLSDVAAAMRTHILINPTGATLKLNCPDGTNALLCGEYVRFTDSQPITWPYAVPPHGSEIIYSLDSSLADSDNDGIPDYQDKCNGTPALQAVNAAGCALGQ